MGGGGGDSGGGGGYSANGNPQIRSTRRPIFNNIKENGLSTNGKQYTLSEHAYNSLFKSQRKDIMPNDLKAALSNPSKPGEGNTIIYINPSTGTKVYVNPATDTITGIQPGSFK